MKTGTRVKLSEETKKAYRESGSVEHIDEFGECEGIVIGETFPDLNCPEVDVRWIPSGLRYGYNESELINIRSLKIRKILID